MKLDRRYFLVWDDIPTRYIKPDGTPVVVFAGRHEYTYPTLDPTIGDPEVQALGMVDFMNSIYGANSHRLEVVNND